MFRRTDHCQPRKDTNELSHSTSSQASYDFDDTVEYESITTRDATHSPAASQVKLFSTSAPAFPALVNLASASTTGLPRPLSHFPDQVSSMSHASTLPKIGTRFSRESIQILKRWLCNHVHHPYPSDKEIELLQRQTGLNRTQIKTWLTNARRRGKVHNGFCAESPYSETTQTAAVDIPTKPAVQSSSKNQGLGPLERWVDSPPEDEPAAAIAIARAVASSRARASSQYSSFSVTTP